MTENTQQTETTMCLTADVVCIRGGDVLLIERGFPPHQGQLALPGGYVDDTGETPQQAAARELLEETGVKVAPDDLTPVGVYNAPGRDPRGRYVTVAYRVTVPEGTTARAADDAAAVRWMPLAAPGELAFDHGDIIRDARRQHRAAAALWVGTYRGHHGGTPVVVTVTRSDTAALPYGWECSCGIAQRFPAEDGVGRSAWRHTHPAPWRSWAHRAPFLGRLVQPTARLRHHRTG
ncbi:NUDIX domain-containing protein [Streptomyces sp. NPDC018019]|uniref:NUDIX domain-containing protein n=1 Tax=Streptomyces sp. NPDC018019 TaxID=3365030 RepID=UPI003794EFF2